jgi:hypothetical protein
MLKVAWTQADLPDALTRDRDRGSQVPLSDELMHDRAEDSMADFHDVCDWSLGYSMGDERCDQKRCRSYWCNFFHPVRFEAIIPLFGDRSELH